MNPERPVVLLHADNFIKRREILKPRVHGRLQCLAAAELLRKGEVSQVVIPGGVTTPNEPPVPRWFK